MCDYINVRVDDIENVVNKLSINTSSSLDKLTAEHIKLADNIVLLLFSLVVTTY